LGEDVASLLDSKLNLLKLELHEELQSYVGGGVRTLVGGLIAAVGFGLVSVGAAFLVSTVVGEALRVSAPTAHSIGFAVVGLLFSLGGAVVARRAARALKPTEVVPTRPGST
jgi:uncharacterized membrane protein YqjE